MSTATATYGLVIGGQRRDTAEYFDVVNPADGSVAGRAPVATTSDVLDAVDAAKAAFPAWAARPWSERAELCNVLAGALGEHAEELAQLLTREQGKPLNGMGSRFELGGAQFWTQVTAALELPVEVVSSDADATIEVHRKPLGVVVSITPWNWPVMIGMWHIVPAILAGNTVVIKPSPLTPLTTLRMVEILNEHLPAGVVNAVSGPDSIAPVLTEHPDVAKVAFTGSTATGKRVMGSAAATLKHLTLELGGNDAGIVLPDSDVDAIAERVFWGALINNGQTCAALKRLYVHDSQYDAMCAALVEVASRVKVGDGLDEASELGPIQNKRQFDRVVGLVEDAKAAGARPLIGGSPTDGPGYFYPVTILADCHEGMSIVDEEQFGPVVPVLRYSDVEDAIARANASEFGLGGSVWSADTERAKQLAMRLESGTAWVNRHGEIRPDTPFGGVKSSGVGVEFGRSGLEEFTSVQAVYA